jgi:glutaredoxin 3
MSDYTLYVKPGCPFCTQAISDLDSKGIYYKLVVADAEILDELCMTSGIKTVPQLFNSNAFIGDSAQLRQILDWL